MGCRSQCQDQQWWNRCTYPNAHATPVPGGDLYRCRCGTCHLSPSYGFHVAFWVFFIFFTIIACFSCVARRSRPEQPPAPAVLGGTPYMVTRSPPRQHQPQPQQAASAQVHVVDGIVVPAWMAQEQQQQRHEQQHPLQQEEAVRLAKESKMTALL